MVVSQVALSLFGDVYPLCDVRYPARLCYAWSKLSVVVDLPSLTAGVRSGIAKSTSSDLLGTL